MKRLTGIAALVAALACGDSRPLVPCSSDAECKQGRKCVEGYCESAGAVGDGSSDPCADSPLTGKYLWDEECYFGTKTPFRDCEGSITVITNSPWEEGDSPQLYDDFKVTYDGLKIFFPEDAFSHINQYAGSREWELLKMFSLSDLKPLGSRCYSGEYETYPNLRDEEANHALCQLRIYPELYLVRKNNEGICVGMIEVLLKDNSWPGEPRCTEEMRDFEEQQNDEGC